MYLVGPLEYVQRSSLRKYMIYLILSIRSKDVARKHRKVSTQQRPLTIYENKSIGMPKLEYPHLNLAIIQSKQAPFLL